MKRLRKAPDGIDLEFSQNNEKRIIRLILLAIIDFAREFPGERDENIAFINSLIKKI